MTPRSTSFAFVIAAYALALVVAITTPQLFPHWSKVEVLIGADFLATLVVFLFSVSSSNSSVYDPYWSVAPIAISFYLVLDADAVAARQALVFLAVAAWGIRLTLNWATGWPGLQHEDWRYVDLREQSGFAYWLVSLTGIHLMPTFLVLLACSALWPAMRSGTEPLGWLDALAAVVTFGSIWLESASDRQQRRHKRTRAHASAHCEEGLWAFSRHPNYLGEIGFWWGLWLFGVSADPSMGEATLAGPLLITALFLVVSIPMIEKKQLTRKPGYADYQKRVSKLLLLPPK